MTKAPRWRFFNRAEFACKHCGRNEIDPAFVDLLDQLRAKVGIPLRVSSGYRCPAHNQAVSTTGPRGPHTTGKAVDLAVDRGAAYLALAEALAMDCFSGIGLKQHGAGRFIHLDILEEPAHRPRPTIWTYP